jgi:hypothetical protein
MSLSYNNSILAQTISVSGTNNTLVTGVLTSTSGNFTNNLAVGSNNLTPTNTLNIINSSNLYLWSNFR